MRELEERILTEGRNLGNGILKVDGFINHQVDAALMNSCGERFAELFRNLHPSKVLTAEISGIAPAVAAGYHLAVPVVYGRKSRPITMPNEVLLTHSHSHTKGGIVELVVSPEYLGPGERVLIIDDFLASGETILGLARLTSAAGATLVGVGTLIEKAFEGGRAALEPLGVPVRSLVSIQSMEGDRIEIAGRA